MKEIWNKVKANRTESIIGAVVVILLIIAGFSLSSSSFNIKELMSFGSDKQSANVSDSGIASNLLNNLDDEDSTDSASRSQAVNSFVTVIDGLYYYNKVKIPVLANPGLFDHSGKIVGCGDEIVWSTVSLDEPTRGPLTAATRLLFSSENNLGFKPGNFLASQDKLSFDRVVIENRIAKFYLEGEFTIEDDCDKPRQAAQLEEVALQFDTVDGVQIYLNNELLQ